MLDEIRRALATADWRLDRDTLPNATVYRGSDPTWWLLAGFERVGDGTGADGTATAIAGPRKGCIVRLPRDLALEAVAIAQKKTKGS